jgi:hypothetical protein
VSLAAVAWIQRYDLGADLAEGRRIGEGAEAKVQYQVEIAVGADGYRMRRGEKRKTAKLRDGGVGDRAVERAGTKLWVQKKTGLISYHGPPSD